VSGTATDTFGKPKWHMISDCCIYFRLIEHFGTLIEPVEHGPDRQELAGILPKNT
jgi:hypothetical protein